MNRRSFLGLILSVPLVPALAKLDLLASPAVAPAVDLLAPTIAAPMMIFRTVLSMLCTTVEPGRIGRIACMPQHAFRPERLIVASHSYNFELLHVAASGEPQLEDAVPAEMFAPTAYGIHLMFSTVEPGEEIVLAVRNMGKEPADFMASFIGSCVRAKTDSEIAADLEYAGRVARGEIDFGYSDEDEDEDDEGPKWRPHRS